MGVVVEVEALGVAGRGDVGVALRRVAELGGELAAEAADRRVHAVQRLQDERGALGVLRAQGVAVDEVADPAGARGHGAQRQRQAAALADGAEERGAQRPLGDQLVDVVDRQQVVEARGQLLRPRQQRGARPVLGGEGVRRRRPCSVQGGRR